MKNVLYTPKRKGFSLLDVLLALGVSAMMFANIAQMQNDMTNNLHSQAVASEMETLAVAAKSYITANYSTLSNMASSAIEVPITGNSGWNGIGDLETTGLLPENFTTNLPMGQTVHLIVKQIQVNGNIPAHLEGLLVSSGGNPMDDRMVGLAMAKMGGDGGGIMKSPPPGVNTSNIQGSFASWTSPISSWSNSGVDLSYGHVAMNLTSTLSPVSEWLDRYATGNPEANRMHTDIDMNNNSLKDTLSVYASGNNDLYLQDTNHTGRVVMWNGGMACQGNADACHFDISDDGGFYDYNDSWITFQGNDVYNEGTGLKIAGKGNNLDVQGKTVAEKGAVVSDSNGITWESSPSVNGAVEAAATYDGTWVNVVGGSGSSGFKGLATNMVKTTEVLDANNNDYYLVPSNYSHLGSAKFDGNIGTHGYDPYDGLPTSWGGGVHTFDIYAEGTIAQGSGGSVNSMMNSSGFIYNNAGCALYMAGSAGGCIYGDNTNVAIRVPGSAGPSGGQVIFQDRAGNLVNTTGHIANVSQTNFGTADGTASAGNGCNPNGAVAASNDGTGSPLACVNGVWTSMLGGYTKVIAGGSASSMSWTNNTGKSVFVTLAPTNGRVEEIGIVASANGNTVCNGGLYSSSHTSGAPPTCAFTVLPDNSFSFEDTSASGGGQVHTWYYTLLE